MKKVTKVFKDLMTPDDQSESWYGWATNQMSHAFLGALIAIFAGTYWLFVTMIFAVTKEGFDLYRAFNVQAFIDSITDILFWIGGSGVVSGGEYRYLFALGLFVLLSVGIYYRIKK